jgi:hypothetical protein
MVFALELQFEARGPQKTLSKGHYRIVCYVPKHSNSILFDELIIEIRVTSTKVCPHIDYNAPVHPSVECHS